MLQEDFRARLERMRAQMAEEIAPFERGDMWIGSNNGDLTKQWVKVIHDRIAELQGLIASDLP